MADIIDKEQIDLATKLSSLMEKMAASQEKITESYQTQIDVVTQLSTVFSKIDTQQTQKQLSNISVTIQQIVKDITDFDKQSQAAFATFARGAKTGGEAVNGMFNKSVTTEFTKSVDNVSKSVKNLGKEEGAKKIGIDALSSTSEMIKLIKQIEETTGASKVLGALGFTGLAKAFAIPTHGASLLGQSAIGLAKTLEKTLPKSIIIATGALSGLYQGFQNVVALGKGVLGFVGGLADSLINVGAAIVSIPLKIFTGIVDIADKANIGMGELRQAIENLRKEFGDLAGPTPKAISTMAIKLQGFADTGLSAWRIFGTLAERLEYMNKFAVGMGATFLSLRKEFVENGGALLAYQKGLGVTEELMGSMGAVAITTGRSLASTLKDTTKYALQMGKAFGIDNKIISKDMVKAFADVKHFANLTSKELSIAVVYSRKLGVELDKIVGTLDAFETFDSAAENVAKLSQAFGVQVDAFKLLEQENPADQIETLRKAFKDAGQDASTFNRQQLKMLASTVGLDEATAKQVFSQKNMGVSLDQIKKKAGESEKKTLTQADAMKQLADSIERLVKTAGGPGGGFFDHFVRGLLGGIQISKEFRGTIRNIQIDLRAIERAGVQVGRAFVKLFPGVSDFFGGLKDLFDPKTFRGFANGIQKTFTDFFTSLTTGNYSFSSFVEKLREQFFNLFDKSKPASQKILSGFKTFMTTAGKLLVDGIIWASKEVSKYVGELADFIANPAEFLKQAKTQGTGIGAEIFKILEPIGKALVDGAQVIWPSLKKLFTIILKKSVAFFNSPEVQGLIKPLYPIIAGLLFGPALARGLATALLTTLSKSVISAFSSGGLKKLFSAGAKKAVEGSAVEASAFTKFLKVGGLVTAILTAGVSVSEGVKKYKDGITGELSDAQKEIGAGSAGLLDTLTLGLLPDSWSKTIAQGAAELINSMEKTFNKLADGLGTSLTGYFGGLFKTLEGLGDVVLGIFDGDVDKVVGGLGKIIKGLSTQILSYLFGVIPSLAIGFVKFSGLLVFKLLDGLAAIPQAILKFFGFTAAAAMYDGVRLFFQDAGKVFGKAVGEFGNTVSEGFKDILNFWTKHGEATTKGVQGVGTELADAQKKALEGINKKSFEQDPSGFITASSSIVDGIKDIKEKLSTINIKDINESLGMLSKISLPAIDQKQIESVANYSTFFNNYSGFLQSINEVSNSIKKRAITSSVSAVQEMISSANKLQEALNDGNLNKIDISTRLNRVATAAGLGSKGTYEIKNKDVVINVSFTVYMDVAEVEKIMVTQQKSVIRDRINVIGAKNPETARQPNFPIKPNTTPALLNGGE